MKQLPSPWEFPTAACIIGVAETDVVVMMMRGEEIVLRCDDDDVKAWLPRPTASSDRVMMKIVVRGVIVMVVVVGFAGYSHTNFWEEVNGLGSDVKLLTTTTSAFFWCFVRFLFLGRSPDYLKFGGDKTFRPRTSKIQA